MSGYKELDVYQRAYKKALEMHRMTSEFPKQEKYEIGSQLRRSAMSIVLNIVEGYGRKDGKHEFQHFLRNALGSCNEVRVLLEMCKDIGYITNEEYQHIENEYEVISRQIYRLRQAYKT